jgi:tRNA-dihydrouridine synthase
MHIPIFGNGDIDSPAKALEYRNRYGVDGVMIGRASIGNPWIFSEIKHFLKTGMLATSPTIEERVRITRKHLDFSIQWKGPKLGIFEMRRHYANYFKGFADFKPFRTRLVEADTWDEVVMILNEVSGHYAGSEVAA